MICPHCELDTPATAEVCEHCEGRLDVIFEEVDQEIRAKHEAREGDRALASARTWLSLALVALVLAGLGRWLLIVESPLPLIEPAYEVRASEPPPFADLELVMPPIELPAAEGAAPNGGG